MFENSQIQGGVLAPVSGLENCMAYCTFSPACQGFVFDPEGGFCWVHTTDSGLETRADLQYYDKTCEG